MARQRLRALDRLELQVLHGAGEQLLRLLRHGEVLEDAAVQLDSRRQGEVQ